MAKRPMVNVPEGKNEANVYRPMNDEEYEQHKQFRKDQEELQLAAEQETHPLIRAVNDMSKKDKEALRKALG